MMLMVSIILCTYNRAGLLPRAVASVVRQTYSSWELIVVDDGSTDNTKNLFRTPPFTDDRIVYHAQSNQGLAAARNKGIRLARGEYLCFLDSDDELRPQHLEKRVRYFLSHPEIDFLYGGMKLIGPRKKHYVVDLENPTKLIHLSRCHVGGTFFFRRKVMTRVRGFRAIAFGEDFDFFLRVERYFSVQKVHYPTYRYHLEAENRLCDVFTEKIITRKKR